MSENSGIDAVTTQHSPVVKTEYYNTTGIPVPNPGEGVYIIRHTHADGTVSISKDIH